jgi:hypothetical protein
MQIIQAATVRTARTKSGGVPCVDILTGEEFDSYDIEDWVVSGTMHSHNTMAAFWSATDTKDETDISGAHCTMGCISEDTVDLCASIVQNKNRYVFSPSRIVDLSSLKTVDKKELKAQTIHIDTSDVVLNEKVFSYIKLQEPARQVTYPYGVYGNYANYTAKPNQSDVSRRSHAYKNFDYWDDGYDYADWYANPDWAVNADVDVSKYKKSLEQQLSQKDLTVDHCYDLVPGDEEYMMELCEDFSYFEMALKDVLSHPSGVSLVASALAEELDLEMHLPQSALNLYNSLRSPNEIL